LDSKNKGQKVMTVEDCISRGVFGSQKNVFTGFRQNSKKINSWENDYIKNFDKSLNKRMGIATTKPFYIDALKPPKAIQFPLMPSKERKAEYANVPMVIAPGHEEEYLANKKKLDMQVKAEAEAKAKAETEAKKQKELDTNSSTSQTDTQEKTKQETEKKTKEKQQKSEKQNNSSKEKVTPGTMSITAYGDKVRWSYKGKAVHGYKTVVSKTSQTPTFGKDHAIYYPTIGDEWGELGKKDAPGTYSVRVCAYTAGTQDQPCIDYSPVVTITKK
jgi:hypothetical protein